MELYYAPLACSLAARIVAKEADVPLALRQVEIYAKTFTDGGDSYLDVAPQGRVPVLQLDDGALLTEVTAVVQYLADVKPDAGLAPRWGTPDRYRLAEWLSFVATELHKKIVFVLFSRVTPDAAKSHARAEATLVFDHLARHLAARDYLVGDRFTAADAYLVWALQLARIGGLDYAAGRSALAAYGKRMRARPAVAELFEEETPLAIAAQTRQ
jgi:glutathione S-transferase